MILKKLTSARSSSSLTIVNSVAELWGTQQKLGGTHMLCKKRSIINLDACELAFSCKAAIVMSGSADKFPILTVDQIVTHE